MKSLDEAIIDVIIQGLQDTLKKIQSIRKSWNTLDPAVKKEIQTETWSIEEVKKNFQKDLAELLIFKINGNCTIIKPRKFLGTENFTKIALVRDLGGEYVSAGKNSHFKIIKKS